MPAIWDAFFFNDELDLLEFRLRELEDHVDRFVIVEATRTYTGKSKPLHFARNRDRYAPWKDRIHHVVAELDVDAEDAWQRERQQRRCMGAALQGVVEANDLVVTGDIDEIPRRELLPWLEGELEEPVRLEQRHALWYVNTFLPDLWDDGTMVCRPGHFASHPRIRFQLGAADPGEDWSAYQEQVVRTGGWHVSSLGGLEAVRAKVSAYSHQEHNREAVIATEHLERVLRYGVRLDGRRLLERVEVDELDPALRRLAEQIPAFVDRRPAPAWYARWAYGAVTWLRATAGLPPAVAGWLDRHHRLVVTGPLTPFLVALQAVLTARRRVRTDRSIWKATIIQEPPL